MLPPDELQHAIAQGIREGERHRFEIERAAEELNTSYADCVANCIVAAIAAHLLAKS